MSKQDLCLGCSWLLSPAMSFQVFMDGDGFGVEIVDGNKYEGNFKDGLPHGKGKKHWVSGDTYDGEWEAGLRHGKGECHYAGGAKYSGNFKNGLFHGHGRYSAPSSSS